MNFTLTKHNTSGLVVLVSILALLLAPLAVFSRAYAADPDSSSHLITIHDRGIEKNVISQEDTLRHVFAEVGIILDDNDIVEPGLDEELVADSYQVNVYRARPVVIEDGMSQIKIMSAYQTPKQVAAHAGISLQDEDKTSMSLTNNLVTDGASLRMVIDRATPLSLTLYGKKETVYTQATTVSEFLSEKNLKLESKDRMNLEQDAPIKRGMKIEIWREGKQTIAKREKLDFTVKQIQDADRPIGYKKVTTVGVPGRKLVTYRVTVKNGKIVKKKVMQTVILKKAIQQVEIVGAKVAGPSEIIAKIKSAATAKGIDAQRVLLIAKCESGFNPRADSGFYKGLFQHDPSYWAGRASKYGHSGASYYDVDAQIDVSTSMMAEGGWSHWGCDPGPQ